MPDINTISEQIYNSRYSFLHTNEHLKNNIVLLGLGGSYAYGTNIDTSDIDIRGVALNSKNEILLGRDFEQVEHRPTDTTIYSFNKFIRLITNCNPNIIELLGLKPEHYFIKTSIGTEIINNKKLFLSQKACDSFGGFINQSLKKLKPDTVYHKNKEKEIAKRMMHIVRLYYTVIDILEKEDVIIYREREQDSLINIRNGLYLNDMTHVSGKTTDFFKISSDFFAILKNFEIRLNYAKKHTSLPALPDYNKINDFIISVNERIVTTSIDR